MKEVDVLILIEHVARELESACLLKAEFERQGKTVVIESAFPNREMLPLKYKIKILVTPWYYTGTKIVKCFLKKSPDLIIVNMHHEQYTVEGNDEFIPLGDAQKVYHVSWGDNFTRQLIEHGCDPEMIFTTGNVRLDFLKKPISSTLKSRDSLAKEFNIDTNKKWSLFIADGVHLLESYQLDAVSQTYYKASTTSRKKYLESVEKLLSRNKDIIFIYRPHPSYADKDLGCEDLKSLKEKYPDNFFAIYKYPLNCWLVSCDTCVSFNSSSLVECYLADIPYYLFRPVDLEDDYTFFRNFEYTIRTYEDFEQMMSTDSSYDQSLILNRLKDFYKVEGYAYKDIVAKSLAVKEAKYKLTCPDEFWRANFIEACIKQFIITISKVGVIKKFMHLIKDNRLNRIIDKNSDSIDSVYVKNLTNTLKNLIEAIK